MPVDRSLAADLAQNLAALYADAETRLIADLARGLRTGIDAPDWADRKRAALTTVRRHAEGIIRRLDGPMRRTVAQIVVESYVRGGRAALADIADAGTLRVVDWAAKRSRIVAALTRLLGITGRRDQALAAELAELRTALPGIDALMNLAQELTLRMSATHLRILRWAEDAYRTVIARASADVLLGTATRLRAAQVAWEQLISQGITGFTDRSGRRWELASYVEMAARTTVAQAAVQGHLDRLGDAGLDLVYVSDSPRECPRCRPWEHKVLTRSGPGGRRTVQVEHQTRDGHMLRVQVAGSVTEAVAAGLLHPNCTHSLSAYLPGVTKLRPTTETANPQGYDDRQHLRYLERQVRAWKRREQGALTDDARARAGARVRDYQAQIRAHTGATGLRRLRHREQIGTAR